MRKGKKALDIIIAIILLIFAYVCFFSIYGNLIGMENVQQNILNVLNQEWGFYCLAILAVITAAYGLFLFLRSIFTKTRERNIHMKNPDGDVHLTESSVESVVEYSVRSFHQVARPDVAVKIHGGKNPTIRSKISCVVRGQYDLQRLAQDIQARVREDLETYVGFPVGDVEVTFTEPDEPQTEQVAG
ncbi:MAG: alkaline shock response membrane anchor protein AmaP [Peptoniphilus sp.]|nr:alkaline shock response membrane anchor protein AmaP [Peptoniphilus sp.]MDD7362537.1 alkaline shock response membrane anchor protein AmaP [Bacillota bacterium]MDY6045064.1 alkaline shock response membrane anchor protein AmaP [Peptoniphilus sp.]